MKTEQGILRHSQVYRAEDCVVWALFENANEREEKINEYCEKNCQYKCLTGQFYKKQ